MTNEAKRATQSIKVTTEDRERILGAIWHRNAVRRNASLPLLDVRREFEREVRRIETARYLGLLQPYLHEALAEVGGNPGIAGRLVQRLRGTQIARRRLRDATGIDRPDHGLSLATGSAWYLTILEIEKAGERPVFGLHDAPHRSC